MPTRGCSQMPGVQHLWLRRLHGLHPSEVAQWQDVQVLAASLQPAEYSAVERPIDP